MKVWIPVALSAVVFLAYALVYYLNHNEGGGGSSFGLVNSVGLVAVVIGIISAGLILRRATPPP